MRELAVDRQVHFGHKAKVRLVSISDNSFISIHICILHYKSPFDNPPQAPISYHISPQQYTPPTTEMAAARPSTWLITGASSGFGKSLAVETLRAGHKVIGTTRDIDKAKRSFPEFADNGGIWLGLDPGQKDAYEQFAKCSQEHRIDVLVNNAGYAFIGGVEDTR